jgi:hypothetical protein
MTTRTPLPSILSSRAAKPGRASIRVSTGNARIIKLGFDPEAFPAREGLDGGSLAFVAVLIGSDIGR